jgi:hypothetical protein
MGWHSAFTAPVEAHDTVPPPVMTFAENWKGSGTKLAVSVTLLLSVIVLLSALPA